jgi:cysteine synthase A
MHRYCSTVYDDTWCRDRDLLTGRPEGPDRIARPEERIATRWTRWSPR